MRRNLQLLICLFLAGCMQDPNCIKVFSHFDNVSVNGKTYSAPKYTCKREDS